MRALSFHHAHWGSTVCPRGPRAVHNGQMVIRRHRSRAEGRPEEERGLGGRDDEFRSALTGSLGTEQTQNHSGGTREAQGLRRPIAFRVRSIWSALALDFGVIRTLT